MSDEKEIERLLNSAGMEWFIESYDALQQGKTEDVKKGIFKPYTENALRTRISKSQKIMSNSGSLRIALKMIANAEKIPEAIKKRAKELLQE